MEFICPTCGKALPRDLVVIIPHTEEHITNEIKKTHPDWATEDGICKNATNTTKLR